MAEHGVSDGVDVVIETAQALGQVWNLPRLPPGCSKKPYCLHGPPERRSAVSTAVDNPMAIGLRRPGPDTRRPWSDWRPRPLARRVPSPIVGPGKMRTSCGTHRISRQGTPCATHAQEGADEDALIDHPTSGNADRRTVTMIMKEECREATQSSRSRHRAGPGSNVRHAARRLWRRERQYVLSGGGLQDWLLGLT